MDAPVARGRILRLDGAAAREAEDVLAAEEPLEIRVNGNAVAVTMRTPGADEDLVRGFLWTEGIALDAAQAPAVAFPRDPRDPEGAPANVALVDLPGLDEADAPWQRNFYTTSSCGVCGKGSLEALALKHPPVRSAMRVPREVLYGLPDALRAAQDVFEATGGLHAAGLFDATGRLLALREDVGRHNAVDKVVGWAWGAGRLPARDLILLVSGRASFEIIQKAVAAGVPVVAAVSAPSSLAVETAESFGVTLVGFLRGRGANVYSRRERVEG